MFQSETSPFFIPQISIPSSLQAYHMEICYVIEESLIPLSIPLLNTSYLSRHYIYLFHSLCLKISKVYNRRKY